MSETVWYAYGGDGKVSGPFFDSRDAVECADGEHPRPVSAGVIDRGDDGDAVGGDALPELDELTHDGWKDRARDAGIAEETDMRSKASIREALAERVE